MAKTKEGAGSTKAKQGSHIALGLYDLITSVPTVNWCPPTGLMQVCMGGHGAKTGKIVDSLKVALFYQMI